MLTNAPLRTHHEGSAARAVVLYGGSNAIAAAKRGGWRVMI
jgi:hypothetical protein